MAVFVTMQVGPVEWGAFRSAVEWSAGQPQEGLRSQRVYRMESDPKQVLVVQQWDSHDAFHTASDRLGDEFNSRAGTEGLDWVTGVWSASDAPVV